MRRSAGIVVVRTKGGVWYCYRRHPIYDENNGSPSERRLENRAGQGMDRTVSFFQMSSHG